MRRDDDTGGSDDIVDGEDVGWAALHEEVGRKERGEGLYRYGS